MESLEKAINYEYFDFLDATHTSETDFLCDFEYDLYASNRSRG